MRTGWRVPLTEEVDQEPSIREATGWSVEEDTAIGRVDGEAESGSESTRVRVGVTKVEDNWGSLTALTVNCVWKWKQQKTEQWNKKEEEEEVGKEVRVHCGNVISGWVKWEWEWGFGSLFVSFFYGLVLFYWRLLDPS